jgi:phage-related holin
MLALLDSVLAFSAIMLGVSLLVTVIVQGLSALVNLRGWALADELAELFAQAKIDRVQSAALAKKILTHPLISDSVLRRELFSHWMQASAIRKEELLELLKRAKELGIDVPNEVKDRLDAAAGVVSEWFDGQMDRVSQGFAHKARSITIFVSFVIAFALHLDAALLVDRMFSDTETRAKLVASVETLQEHAKRLGVAPADDAGKVPATEGASATGASDELTKAASEIQSIRSELADAGMDILPKFVAATELAPERGLHTHFDYLWWKTKRGWRHFLGIVAAGALLSLGAPFWFNLLSQLANLRTVLANREKEDRGKSRTEAG